MANTERLFALQKVTEARKEVSKLRTRGGLTDSQQALVDTLYTRLMDLEDVLILSELNASIEKLEDGAKDLAALTKKMKRSSDNLKKVADYVETAGKVLGTLADIASKATSAGMM